MIILREAKDIHQSQGRIENGTFRGRWHFSFDEYHDPAYINFGALRVFNDDTLSPGAVWPLHPHREIEVVTYCVSGEFRHADEHGKGGILKKGWVQHTTVGRGMFHSEINNSPREPMRFIQMWFFPDKKGLVPFVEQKKAETADRTNKLLPLVSNDDEGALEIYSDAKVYSSFLKQGKILEYEFKKNEGGYLYVLEGEGLSLSGKTMNSLDAAMIKGEDKIIIRSLGQTEFILVVV